MKIPIFKIRASACSKIMGKKGLGATGETYCKNWLKGKLFNRQVEIKSKYLEKGNIMEDNSLDEIAKRLGIALLISNTQHFENDFMTGTPDALTKIVIEVKNSWSWETLPLLETEIPKTDYFLQVQCYMALTGKKSAKLIYTLLDTPIHLIKNEAYWYSKNNGYEELSDEMLADFVKKMTYSDIPDKYKYKCFDIKYDEAIIIQIRERVMECREYIEHLIALNSL